MEKEMEMEKNNVMINYYMKVNFYFIESIMEKDMIKMVI